MEALTHAVTEGLARCALTFRERSPIDVARAREQHAAYVSALRMLGVEVTILDVNANHPDAVFIEDTAVVLDEVAIAASMGASSRAAEVPGVLPALGARREVLHLPTGATLDGGDVLRWQRTLYVGHSSRTNGIGVEALATLVAPYDYAVVPVKVRRCLHLKTAVTALGDRLVVFPGLVDEGPLGGIPRLDVPPDEPEGANVLWVNEVAFVSASAPKTAEAIERTGVTVHVVMIDELEKAEAGLTCLSLLVR